MSQFKGNRLNFKSYHFIQDWEYPTYPNQPNYFLPQIPISPYTKSSHSQFQPLSLKDATRRYLYRDLDFHLTLSRSLNPDNLPYYKFLTDLLELYPKFHVEELTREQYLRFGYKAQQKEERRRRRLPLTQLSICDLQDRLLGTPRPLICLREGEPPLESNQS
jgi:hypothetical protein